MKSIFKIKGLDCANCALCLENVIKKLEGVSSATVNFMTEKMVIEHSEEKKQEVIERVRKAVKKEEPDVVLELV